MDAIQNSAAGKTGAISGNMLKALQTNASGLANQDYSQWYNNLVNSWQNLWGAQNTNYNQQYQDQSQNRNQIISALGGISASGQNAAVQTGGFGQSAVNAIGNNIQTAAGSQGLGAIGQANALSGVLNNPSLQSGITNGLNFLVGNGGGSSSGTGPYNYTGGYTPIQPQYGF